jgi:hypothetical protein
MTDELETVLRLVRDGRISAEEAAPIVEALGRARRSRGEPPPTGPSTMAGRVRRHLRIRITEHGRQVVNLRIPIGFADAALRAIPGIDRDQAARIRSAVDSDDFGPILDVEDESGDGVLIGVE